MAEPVSLDTESLRHCQVQIRQRDSPLFLVWHDDMRLVFVPAAGQQNWQVAVGVSAAVSHAAAEQHLSRLQQIQLLQLANKPAQLIELILFNPALPRHQLRILPVVRVSVITLWLQPDASRIKPTGNFDRGNASGIGLQRQRDQVEENG